MLIYLDLNVIEHLKKEDSEGLLGLIQADQSRNVYCFSEAHLYDLCRDQTDEKFDDMELLKEIAENHCFSFDNEVVFQYETPREFYDRFDWTPVMLPITDTFSGFDFILESFKLIPINFSQTLMGAAPENMPEHFKKMLFEPTTLYDFVISFYDFSKELNEKQKSFKALLQYLRKHDYVNHIFPLIGIKGFNGTEITDREAFLSSYSEFCNKNTSNLSIYDSFVRMYYCLEFLGIVKGNAQKQRMLNMANDGRHAFFGGYCDIIVSRDEDFLKKARLLYSAVGIYPCLMNGSEFIKWVEAGPRKDDNIAGLINEVLNIKNLTCIDQHQTETMVYTSYALNKIYFEYFDVLTVSEQSGEYFFYFQAEKIRFSKGTLLLQIKLLLNLLLADLGPDIQNKGGFYYDEMSEDGWPGRAWFHGEYQVELHLQNGLNLTFNPIPNLP